MIDPLEAVLALLASNADLNALTAGQVAAKHRFGNGWEIGSKAVQVRYDGGAPDLYTPRQLVRLEARCFGESQREAAQVWAALVGVTRATHRTVVETGEGKALVYWLLQASGPSLLQEEETGADMVLCFLETAVSEVDVP